VIDGRFAMFGRVGQAPKAVKVGTSWLLFDGSGTPERAAEDAAWLAEKVQGATIGALLVASPNWGTGAAAWALDQHLPILVAPGSRTSIAASLQNWGRSGTAFTTVERGRWLRIGGDSAWIEPIDLPNIPGSLLVWVPSLHWLYASTAAPAPFGPMDRLLALARSRKWAVEYFGSFGAISTPVPKAQ